MGTDVRVQSVKGKMIIAQGENIAAQISWFLNQRSYCLIFQAVCYE